MEIEIKFQVLAGERRGLSAALRAQSSVTERLQARYFDTPCRALARAGIGLRLRKEGKQWVQTLKTAAHGGALVRTEHNVPLPPGRRAPVIDIERHRGSDGWAALRRALRQADGPLAECYTTDMRRIAARVGEGEGKGKASVEYALDTGIISAAAAAPEKAGDAVLAVSELEIELLSGTPEALFGAARRLLQERPLWIDVRSKAMRGESLSGGSLVVAAARASDPALRRRATLREAGSAALGDCVRQLALNLSQIAAPEGYGDDHVHQARVALRRLRTALSLFPGPQPAAPERKDVARELGRRLGASRDLTVMAGKLWPVLRDAGAPLVELAAPPAGPLPAEAVRMQTVQLWLLELLAETLAAQDDHDGERWTAVRPTLDRWHAQCRKGAKRFATMDDEQRHTLRKRLKRLRYGSEFIASACPRSKQQAFGHRLGKALQALGDYNDVHTALLRYQEAAGHSPQAWFAAGWLAARLSTLSGRCERALCKFARVEAPWA